MSFFINFCCQSEVSFPEDFPFQAQGKCDWTFCSPSPSLRPLMEGFWYPGFFNSGNRCEMGNKARGGLEWEGGCFIPDDLAVVRDKHCYSAFMVWPDPPAPSSWSFHSQWCKCPAPYGSITTAFTSLPLLLPLSLSPSYA